MKYGLTFAELRGIAMSERWKAKYSPPSAAAGYIARAQVIEQLIEECEEKPLPRAIPEGALDVWGEEQA